jgi:hypothetical protein
MGVARMYRIRVRRGVTYIEGGIGTTEKQGTRTEAASKWNFRNARPLLVV